VAGAAQELQKTYDAAVNSFTEALNNAPEAKRAAINDLLQKCIEKRANDTSAGVLDINYDKFADKTTVSLRLRSVFQSHTDFDMSMRRITFNGRAQTSSFRDEIEVDFDNCDQVSRGCSGYGGELIIIADSSRLNLTNTMYRNYAQYFVPIWVFEALARSKDVEGRVQGMEFRLTPAHRDLLRRYLAAILPSWYDPGTIDHASSAGLGAEETVDYINQLLNSAGSAFKLELRDRDNLVFTKTGIETLHIGNKQSEISVPYVDVIDAEAKGLQQFLSEMSFRECTIATPGCNPRGDLACSTLHCANDIQCIKSSRTYRETDDIAKTLRKNSYTLSPQIDSAAGHWLFYGDDLCPPIVGSVPDLRSRLLLTHALSYLITLLQSSSSSDAPR